MFERLISIDWSGAATDTTPVALRIAQWDHNGPVLVPPPSKRRRRSWSRDEALAFLTAELHPGKPRTAVACDFAFGLPWGSDREVFGVDGWRPMLCALRDLYAQHGTARSTASALNESERFHGHGPFRFDESRSDFRFYMQHGVPYYRMIELFLAQASSVWYLGSGAAVGFHTITGLVCLARLLDTRDRGLLNFSIWPHEGPAHESAGHLLLEGYPSIVPGLGDNGPCKDDNERDAWRMLSWMQHTNEANQLENRLQLPTEILTSLAPDALDRVQFEGWIAGAM